MKKMFFALGVLTLGGCYSAKQFQVEMANAELIKIDTVMRYDISPMESSWKREQQLTWVDDYNNRYVSYASLKQQYTVGTRITVLRSR